jgi:hypothetical protein
MMLRGEVVVALLLSGAVASNRGALGASKKSKTTTGAVAKPAATAEPVPIPFHDKTTHTKGPHIALDLTIPAFDHPSPVARAAIAAIVDRQLGLAEFTRFSAGYEGAAELNCEVLLATTSLISYACRSTKSEFTHADLEQGMAGGAPAEPNLETYQLVLDGDRVREGTLADLIADPARDEPALLKRIQAAMTAACPSLKLLPEARIGPFTINDEGATFYFSIDDVDFAHLADDSGCERRATLSRADLRGLRKTGGMLDRLRPEP